MGKIQVLIVWFDITVAEKCNKSRRGVGARGGWIIRLQLDLQTYELRKRHRGEQKITHKLYTHYTFIEKHEVVRWNENTINNSIKGFVLQLISARHRLAERINMICFFSALVISDIIHFPSHVGKETELFPACTRSPGAGEDLIFEQQPLMGLYHYSDWNYIP